MDTPVELKELLKRHEQDVKNINHDPIYEEAYNYGGIYFVEKLIEIFKQANVYDNVKAPMFVEVDGKIYKRLN